MMKNNLAVENTWWSLCGKQASPRSAVVYLYGVKSRFIVKLFRPPNDFVRHRTNVQLHRLVKKQAAVVGAPETLVPEFPADADRRQDGFAGCNVRRQGVHAPAVGKCVLA